MVKFRGFTLIELLVVLAIIATLLSIVTPRYFKSIDHSKERVLRTNLATVRDAIDKYYADKGLYPDTLQILVDAEYLKNVPKDPITDSIETWVLLPSRNNQEKGIADIRSGSDLIASDSTSYSSW